jgi:hypothetical protein
MKSDDNMKPVYQVRAKNGGTLFEGGFEDMVKWLAANKITGNDEMRRLGYATLEKDELWGRVSDFPEFHHSEREGRRMLSDKLKAARSMMIAGAGVFLLGVGLLAWNQAWPRYIESSKVAESRKIAEEAQKDAIDRISKANSSATRQVNEAQTNAAKAVSEAKASADAIKSAAEKLKDEAVAEKAAAAKLSREASDAMKQMTNELTKAKADAAAAIRAKEEAQREQAEAIANLQAAIDAKTATLTRDLNFAVTDRDAYKAKLDKLNKTMPLLVKWRPGVFQQGCDFEYFNYSGKVLSLRFKVTLLDGSVKEKSLEVPVGGWHTMKSSFHEDFKPGERVTVSQEGSSEYELEVYLCPGK